MTLKATFVLTAYCITFPASGIAPDVTHAEEESLVTLELRYHMPKAGAVELVWGINGWSVAPKARRPAGTTMDINRLMHTPMRHDGDVFDLKLQVPAGTLVNYGFRITRDRQGQPMWAWDETIA